VQLLKTNFIPESQRNNDLKRTPVKSIMVRLKVKCTLVQAMRLCRGRTTHRGSGGIALLFLDHGIRRG